MITNKYCGRKCGTHLIRDVKGNCRSTESYKLVVDPFLRYSGLVKLDGQLTNSVGPYVIDDASIVI